jgi:hypothetical protein
MANKLTDPKRAKMFAAFCEKQSIEYVARQCRVSQLTVRRYRGKDNWDKRLSQIRQKAEKKTDKELANRLAENLKLVQLGKDELVKKIREGKDKSQSTYKDLDNMIRLEEFLMGRPDSRPAASEYEKMTDEELQKRLDILEAM